MTESAAVPFVKPHLSILCILGLLHLVGMAGVYLVFGLSAYPRQEWIIESLGAIVCLLPVVHLLRGLSPLPTAVRYLGAMLLLHSIWDALHWPGGPMIDTPMEAWIPRICPGIDAVLGFFLVLRGK